MRRLITFGCSHTYGQCLSSRQLAWPYRLASLLNLECINCGEEGASNKRIWYNIVNFDFNKDDTIVVQWSYPERWCVLDSKDVKHIGSWKNDPTSTNYYKYLFSHYDSNVDANLRMSHIDLVFENLRLYHVLSQNDLYSNLKFNKANILDIDFDNIRETNEKGDDGVHAGPKAHQIFAEQIAKEIKNDTR